LVGARKNSKPVKSNSYSNFPKDKDLQENPSENGWLRGTVVERRSLTVKLSLSCARPSADGRPLMGKSSAIAYRSAKQADSAFYPFGIDK